MFWGNWNRYGTDFAPPIAHAATFTVTNLNDSGVGSLRQAILDANAASGTNTITFQAGLAGTITLTTWAAGIAITSNLAINGPGASQLAINGNDTYRIFSISSGVTVTINGLTLRGGSMSTYGGGNGGCLTNDGTLTISNSALSKNTAIGWNGGAIANWGSLTINNSDISENSSTSGGGIANYGQLIVRDSTLSGNSADGGGAIMSWAGSVTIDNSIFFDNSGSPSLGYGGAIYNYYQSTLTVSNSTFSGNTTGVYGGGIYGDGVLNVINTTLVNNSAGYGGGISTSNGTLTVNNSTISGNSATSWGGGISTGTGATLTVNNSTISGNTAAYGGGVGQSYSGATQFANSLVAGNNAPNGKEIGASYTTFTSQGHNLFGENGTSGLVNANPIASDLILAGAIGTAIGSLANNGGPTKTHLPVAGSPAIDGGDNALIPAGMTTDQRGPGFPRISNGTVDIGAVEKASVCDPNLKLIPTPLKPVFGPTGGGGTLTVVIASQCPWTARSNVSWITLTGSKSGTGSGTVTFTVSPNSTASSRSGTIAVAQKTATIFQRTGYQIDPPRPIPPKR